jgi:hypothetical protein
MFGKEDVGNLNAISMMDIYVDVEDPWVVLEQLQDGHHNVVYIAKPARLELLKD